MSGSSPAEEIPATTTEADQGVNAADTPAAEQGVNDAGAEKPAVEFDALAVTRAALKETAEAEKPSVGDAPGPDEGKTQDATADAAADAKKADDADDAKLPFGNHPRWKAVMAERNEARRLAAEYEPNARQYGQVLDFMASNNLVAKEVQEGFAIMAALKNTPEKALEMLRPHYERLQHLVGEKLPEDLNEKVQDGRLDEASARELAQTRGKATLLESGAREQQERQAAAAEDQASRARAEAADTYVATKQANDPDFALKQPLLRGAIREALDDAISEGRSPKTPADVNRIMDTAYGKVTAALKAIAPARARPVSRPVPSGMSSTPATAVPRTALDVTKAALAASRG